MASKHLRPLSSSEEVHQMMIDIRKAERDVATRLSRARKDGFAEGFAEGLAEARAEHQLEAARRLFAMGKTPDEVCHLLDLTPDQLPKP